MSVNIKKQMNNILTTDVKHLRKIEKNNIEIV